MQSDTVINVSLKEFFWSLLEKWKLVLLVGLIFAVIFPFALAQKEKRDAEANASAKAQYAGLSREEILNNLDDSSRQEVITAAHQANVISGMDNYNANSLLTHIDLNNAETIHMKWVVTGSDNSDELASAYSAVLTDSVMVETVKQALGNDFADVEEVYIRELFNTENDGSSVDLYIFIPQGANEQDLHDAVNGRVEAIKESLSASLGAHRLVSVVDETIYTCNLEMTEEIIVRNNDLKNLRDWYKAEVLTFSDLQIKILNSLISGEEDKAVVTSDELSDIPVFTARRLLIGFVIGEFIYVFFGLLRILFSPKMQNSECLNKSYQIRLLGKNSKYGYKGIKALAHSKIFYNLHNKRYQGDKTIDDITASIIQSCKYNEVGSVALVSVGKINDESRVKQFAEKIKKSGSVSVKTINGTITDKEIENSEAVVFCVEKDITEYKDIQKVYELCNCYDRPIIGGICLI